MTHKPRHRTPVVLALFACLPILVAAAPSSPTRPRVVLETVCGDIVVELHPEDAPQTVANFTKLVKQGFYDSLTFHRVVPGFVIQGGDPTGTGTSGPGYSTVDPVPPGTKYTLGVAAMAKTAAEKAGTAGSQFFIVTTKDARLPPDYAVLGKVVGGLDNVERIGQLGSGQTGSPTRLVEIRRATVDVH